VLTASYVGNRSITVGQAEPVAPAPGQVQIKVAYTGLCGTDLHIMHGNMDARVTMPLVFGHEMSGTIAALGDGVTGWSVGDAVTVMPLDWDGTCSACLAGNQHICQNLNFIGIDSPGSLQGYWNVPAEVLVGLPSTLRLDHAALVEPTAVAVHDVRRGNVQKGDKVVVIGGGPIGVLIASVAREFGGDVVVIELDPNRRAQIGALGFETLDLRETNQIDWVTQWTGGAGADIVFEVSGAAAAVLGATDLAKVRGSDKSKGEEKCRLFGAWGGVRYVITPFSFVRSRILRKRKAWLAAEMGIEFYADFKTMFGKRWWHHLGQFLLDVVML